MDRTEQKKEAKKLYRKGWKLKDIAQKINVPQGTVRRWKAEEEWDDEQPNKKSERSPNARTKKANARQRAPDPKNRPGPEENGAAEETSELSDKQRLFCQLYVRSFNATTAYQKAYACTRASAMTNGSRLLKNDKVKTEIEHLKKEKVSRLLLSENDVFEKMVEIAFSDITDYVRFDRSVVLLNDSDEVDGSLISEIKQGKDGISIKLADKMKALLWLADHMDLATEEQRARIDLLKKQAQSDIEEENTGIVMIMPTMEGEEENEDNLGTTGEATPDDGTA
ncbi:MAG: terminase small subunit [Lachnospiraceae bacterium]